MTALRSPLRSVLRSPLRSPLVRKFGAEPPELIVNGTFDADISGWTASDAGTGAVTAWDSGAGGRMALPRLASSANRARGYQAVTTVPGRQYRLTLFCAGTAGVSVIVGSTVPGSADLVNTGVAVNTTGTFNFTATSTTTYVMFQCGSNSATSYVDNVSVKQV